MKRTKIITAAAGVVFAAAMIAATFYLGGPFLSDQKAKSLNDDMHLLELYEKNKDLRGWILVEGTNIDYPVMNSEYYLDRAFDGKYDAAGCPFLSEGWKSDDAFTLIYGHNMRYYKTMFNGLEKFTQRQFFEKGRRITFYAICEGEKPYVEKRTYLPFCAARTSVDTWNYWHFAGKDENDVFIRQADEKSENFIYPQNSGDILVLSTCSYHVRGKKGRLIVCGELLKKEISEYGKTESAK